MRRVEAEQIDLAKLPRVEDITAETDMTQFLDSRVPAALRNAALGRAWALDPTIRDFIEVAENQWNWNVPGGAPGYGPLEPGTDIAKLLAQATGAIWKESPTKDVDGDHEVVSSSIAAGPGQSVEDAALQHNLTAEIGSESPAAPALADIAPPDNWGDADIASQHRAADAEPIPVGGMRRHGGALPD